MTVEDPKVAVAPVPSGASVASSSLAKSSEPDTWLLLELPACVVVLCDPSVCAAFAPSIEEPEAVVRLAIGVKSLPPVTVDDDAGTVGSSRLEALAIVDDVVFPSLMVIPAGSAFGKSAPPDTVVLVADAACSTALNEASTWLATLLSMRPVAAFLGEKSSVPDWATWVVAA